MSIRLLKTIHTATHPGRLPTAGEKEARPEPTAADVMAELAREAAAEG